LMATSRPVLGSWARYTWPIPPAPSGSRIVYGPSFASDGSGMPWIRLSLTHRAPPVTGGSTVENRVEKTPHNELMAEGRTA
jgi:hypothetical protein